MENDQAKRRLKIISGSPLQIEAELNELLEEWSVIVWNFTPMPVGLVVTCVLIANAEVRKSQLLNITANRGNRG